MTKLISKIVADMIPARKSLVDRMCELQDWADKNIHDCQMDCDSKGRIKIQLEGDEVPLPVGCPVFSRECNRGKAILAEMRQKAEDSVPSEIPERYRKSIVQYDETEAIRGARQWNGAGVMYICGSTGTGKTYAAAWWVYNRLFQRLEKNWDEPFMWQEAAKYEMRWFSAFDICIDRTIMQEARNAPLLIIDDLGCEVESATNKAIINDLIANRYSHRKPTIITSNLSMEELQSRYKDRMYERILQTGHIVDAGSFNKRL